MELFSNIAIAFREDGIWMWAIFAAQMVSIAIIIERVYALFLNRSHKQKDLARKFEEDIKKGQIEKVLTKARSLGESNPIGLVVQAGAQAALDMGGREEIQAKMDEILLTENSKLETRTGFLATLGNVGTLLGLLGTVIGMIQCFSSVSSLNAMEKAAVLSKGISVAMHCTAYGLIMAIPALVMYAVLQNRANALSEDLNQSALMVYNWLSFNYESVPQKKVRA